MRTALTPLVLVLAMASVACGGASGPSSGGSSGALTTVHDAVPADVAWAVVGRNHPDHVELARTSFVRQLSNLPGPDLEEAMAYTGIDWSAPDALDQTGLDLTGEYAIFALTGAPVVLFELADRDAFVGFLANLEDSNPDWDTRHGDWLDLDEARAWDMTDGTGLDLGIAGRFAVLRLRSGIDGIDMTDDDVARSLRGFAAGERFYDAEPSARLRQLSDGEVWTYAWARTGALDDLVRAGLAWADVETTDGDVCDVARERFATTLPWVGAWTTYDATDPMHSTSGWVAHFSAAGAERMRAALPPTVGTALAHADGAAWATVGSANLRALVDLVQADPAAARCPGIAALPGALAGVLEREARNVDYNLGFFDGTFGFGLFDIRMAGFLPFIDATVMIGSENPTRLMEAVQRMIEQQGGRGEVDVDAALTTLEYGLMHLSITLVQAEDRVVLSVGDVPQAFTNTLATAARDADDAPFFHFAWDGERVRALLDMGLAYVRDNGILAGDQLDTVRASLAQWYIVERMTMTAGFDAADLVMTATTRIDPDAAPAE